MTSSPAPAAAVSGIPFWRTTALALLVVGVAVTLAGAFGPWLRSGTVDRNSFQIVGALQRFPLIDNSLVRALIGAWPLLGPALMIPLVLAGLRWWRTTGVTAIVLGILGLAPSIAALVVVGGEQRFGIELVAVGPLTVVAGAALLIVAGTVLLASGRRDIRVVAGAR